MRLVLTTLSFTILFAGCIGIFDYDYEKHVMGRYYLTAIDSREDMSLSYNPEGDVMYGGVGATVFAVGYDQDYIVVKQHPRGPNAKDTTNYFIVKTSKTLTQFPEKELIGPLTHEQFNAKMSELGRNIPFTTVLKDLE